jgi:hypothetical protein
MSRHNVLNSPQDRRQIPRQQRALAALEDAEADVSRFHGCSPPEALDDDLMKRAFQDAVFGRDKAVGAAIRAGLGHHPLVLAWLENQRGLGQWDLLRSTRTRHEKGVRRPMKPDHVLLAAEVSKLIEGSSEERKPEGIRRRLVARLLSLATRKVEAPHIDWATASRLHKRVHGMSREGWRKLMSALDD